MQKLKFLGGTTGAFEPTVGLYSSFTSCVSQGDCRAIYQVRYNEFLTARQPGCYFCRVLDCKPDRTLD
jgi:hypothetical protein